jgi:hypothetical protein
MPYYKAPDNSLHFLSASDIAAGGERLLPKDAVAITDQEAEAIRVAAQPVIQTIAPQPTFEDVLAVINATPSLKSVLDARVATKGLK